MELISAAPFCASNNSDVGRISGEHYRPILVRAEGLLTAAMNEWFSIGLIQGQSSLIALTRIFHYLHTVLADFPSTTAFSAADQQSHLAPRHFSTCTRVDERLARIARRDDECNLD